MKVLSNESLLETIKKAKKLQLDSDFIKLLEFEIERRNISDTKKFYS
ncbi:sporulation histidine kinase inhibitor Sda [Lederbergia wuyishanensis]|uniref:Sporulation histidine kinase inhibitor Sda n=1 Tax=Lederbergia wuyishanensis TaxID=1347903 RepID=A0ABU0D9T2_9BACI|nr:sporulation histidine kinase inhibitor Sda [Lederbergia wuyishanensis]MCJ8007412.1 sporulation histidine kinase inhibitor Sda [Lederbergia wuyishanensis]MDQ0345150.1 hypothetical protein [Lederbergia wuyishanensis]